MFAALLSALGAYAQDLDRKAVSVKTPDGVPVSPAPASKYSIPAKPGPPPAPPHEYGTTAPAPVDGQATTAAKNLYKSLRAQYGKKIISGHTSDQFDAFKALAGKTPVVRAYDMQDYSPRNPWNDQWNPWDDGSIQAAIDWHAATKKKGIVTFQWHWFSPSGGQQRTSTFNTKETTFDVSKAVVPGTVEYADTLRDIDAIAVQLKRLRDAGVPVLWRPLHEAAGGWFWWGAKGPDACLKLYGLMYDRLTSHHQLHNLIWVWSEPNASWYPGNEKVDIVGYDSYPGKHNYDPQKAMFDKLYTLVGGKKMIAMTETGPIPGIDAALNTDARWSYIMTWAKNALDDNEPKHIKEMYSHPAVVTLEGN